MPLPMDNPALYGAGGCGAHQQVYGVIDVGGGPVEPLIFLDFKNGVYTVDGVVTDVNDLLADLPGAGDSFDPSMIQAGVGLVGAAGNTYAVFAGAAATLALAGSTTLATLIGDGGVADTFSFEIYNDEGLDYLSTSSFENDALNSIADQVDGLETELKLEAGTAKIALTFIDSKIVRSSNGRAVLVIDPAEPSWVASPPENYAIALAEGMICESIGLYPPQDDAELPALSAL
jgi:hypothetical protein